ncbi:unnamed protein product [Mytilus coruscus]|uniref:Uncharacterized protein n=1 Tax=Mytilus coruscus TaxID=42192 RepID=A0A6J8EWF5_MYTCO|nr:unnamed protein product [Mytilus coruscus]
MPRNPNLKGTNRHQRDIGAFFPYIEDFVKSLKSSVIAVKSTDLKDIYLGPWFDKTCEEKRRLFHKARKSYNRFKNEANRTCLSVASRNYKSAMDTSFKQYQDKITSDLRTSSKSDTKKFWNILNRCTEKSDQSIKASIAELYNYFKEMNEVEEEVIETDVNLDGVNLEDNNEIL